MGTRRGWWRPREAGGNKEEDSGDKEGVDQEGMMKLRRRQQGSRGDDKDWEQMMGTKRGQQGSGRNGEDQEETMGTKGTW